MTKPTQTYEEWLNNARENLDHFAKRDINADVPWQFLATLIYERDNKEPWKHGLGLHLHNASLVMNKTWGLLEDVIDELKRMEATIDSALVEKGTSVIAAAPLQGEAIAQGDQPFDAGQESGSGEGSTATPPEEGDEAPQENGRPDIQAIADALHENLNRPNSLDHLASEEGSGLARVPNSSSLRAHGFTGVEPVRGTDESEEDFQVRWNNWYHF